MAPLILDFDSNYDMMSLSSHHHDAIDQHKTGIAPLHENTITTTPRCVSFGIAAALETIHEVISRVDYTPEEIEASWFGRDDMSQMKQNAKSEAKLVDSGLLVESKDVSIRGLEGRTRDGIRRKRQNRMNAYSAVFYEVEWQKEVEFFDEDLIADAYFFYSEPCQVSAQMIGKRDELEAMDISLLLSLLEGEQKNYFGTNFCKTIVDLSTTEGLASSAA